MRLDSEIFAEMFIDTIKRALLGPLVKGRTDALEERIEALEVINNALMSEVKALQERSDITGIYAEDDLV